MRPVAGTVAVLGAGSVGVSVALALQARGAGVTLIDREGPAAGASHGNAGIMPPNACAPFNGPGLWRDLPGLLLRPSGALRVDPLHALRRIGWVAGFLARARRGPFEATARALDALIRLSMTEHERLMGEAGVLGHLRRTGWLFLYRDEAAFAATAGKRAFLAGMGVVAEPLDRDGIAALEPHVSPAFARGLAFPQSWTADDPGGVIRGYARLFEARGGALERIAVSAIEPEARGWTVWTADGRRRAFDRVVVALGAWSRALLARARIAVPLLWERGYHMHYRAAGAATLSRPVYDPAGGYVLAPMARGLRLTTGVEFAACEVPPSPLPLARAERAARAAFPLAERLDPEPWLGRRPTLPDSRPMIGAAPGRPGLWLAFGHQHVGWTTGPGTGALLAAMIAGDAPPIDPAPFAPGRFLR